MIVSIVAAGNTHHDAAAPFGSSAVREFIQEHQPDICLCGHIHESKAEEYIGRTHVINPGTLGNGGYVVLHLENEAGRTHVRATLRSLY